MDHPWRFLAGAVPVAIACALATADPALRPLGDLAVVAVGVASSVVVWVVGGRRGRAATSWRLLAVAPLLPVVGAAVAAIVDPADPLSLVLLRWVPTVPGYLIAVVAILGLVDRARLRSGGPRVAVEVALFLTACLVAVQVLVLGPHASWAELGTGARLILGAAVVATSATMAAALTLLAVIEARRQRMAVVLLIGAGLLTAGRGLATSALLSGALGAVDVSRFLVSAGLGGLALAVLVDPGPAPGGAPERAVTGRSTQLRSLLPHMAMVVAAGTLGVTSALGHRPSIVAFAGALLCAGLAAVHRWLSAREEQRTGTRLRRSEAWFRSLVSSSSDAVVLLDDNLRVTWASPALGRVLGPAAAALTGRRLLDAVHPEDAAPLAAALSATDGTRPDPGLLTLRVRGADDAWSWLEAGVADLRDDPSVGAVVLHCRDVTDRHAREEALRSVAYTDPMTGLPNRAGCMRALDRALAEQDGAPDASAAFLLIELDGLAEAREHAGRDAVSTVEAEVGRRLRSTVREDDVVARLAGGAFAILAHETATDADQLAHRCLAVVEQPIATAAGIVDLTAAVGLVGLEAGLSVADLMVRADLAVRAARASGPGSAARYEPALGEAAARRDRLRADLQGARARGELFLLFQPIVSVTEQRVTGVEALLRWRHPTFGDVPPTEFLPIAERAGLIADLQRWTLEQSMRAAASLPSAGEPLRLGVNVPAAYAAGGTLVGDVEAALRASGFGPELLVLEISEGTVLSGDERIGLDITTLRLMGVHVALDDFGAGAASLTSLTRLPIDVLKLDRSFVAQVDRDAQSRALCESVVSIGRALGVDVVAEGVETPSQLAAVCGFGAGFVQGFLISRPMPQSDLARLLEERAGVLWPGLVGSR